jgi:predicted nucleic acid-binding protein
MAGGLMFLVDTNVWLELLLEQEKASQVRQFMQTTQARLLAITDFSLHSIALILTRLKKADMFEDFLSDTIEDSGIARVRLDTIDIKSVLGVQKQFGLDFDDAYQYVAAEKYSLTLVSFDSDFDRTERGRRSPAQVLSGG